MQVPITEILKGFQQTVVKNSPAILTAIGVTGTISTAVLTARATHDALADLQIMLWTQDAEHFATLDEVMSIPLKERVRLTWQHYLPPVAVGTVTIACVLGANHISTKRSTALVTAYSLTERAFAEYRDKVVEQIGANKEQKVRDAVAQDRVHADPVSNSQVIITGRGKVLCYESYTARYFECDVETIRKAQNDINEQIINEMYATLNDFNRAIGLPYAGIGEDVGWNTDKMLDIRFSTVMAEDERTPCISIGYKDLPFPNYGHFH